MMTFGQMLILLFYKIHISHESDVVSPYFSYCQIPIRNRQLAMMAASPIFQTSRRHVHIHVCGTHVDLDICLDHRAMIASGTSNRNFCGNERHPAKLFQMIEADQI
jgi:hypothetical protein